MKYSKVLFSITTSQNEMIVALTTIIFLLRSPGYSSIIFFLCRYVPLSSRVFIKHRESENSPFTRLNSPANVWYSI